MASVSCARVSSCVSRRGRSSTSRRSLLASAALSMLPVSRDRDYIQRPIGRPVFACLNVRSLTNKLDDVIEFVHDNNVDTVFD